MPLRLHLLRHGQTPCSRANVFCGSGTDPSLTPEGVEMGAAFARFHADHVWAGLYVSPLRRTCETAAEIPLRGTVLDGLREIGYGAWEGKSVEEVEAGFHDDYLRWVADPGWQAPTDGERGIEVAQRAVSAVEEIRAQHAEGDVLAVSHKATIRILACALLGIDVGRFRYRFACPVGSVTVIRFDRHGPMLERLADTSHLSERLRTLPGT